MKTAITGGPGTGKTHLSKQYQRVLHCDDFVHLGWSEASEHIAGLFDDASWECCEGVQIPRAARKWLASHKTGRPFDHLILLNKVWRPQSAGQSAMGKGVRTVLDEIAPELLRRGVHLEIR